MEKYKSRRMVEITVLCEICSRLMKRVRDERRGMSNKYNIHMAERERRGRRKCPVISAPCTLLV